MTAVNGSATMTVNLSGAINNCNSPLFTILLDRLACDFVTYPTDTWRVNNCILITSGYATWFTAGDAMRIAHYDVIDDVITRKL